MIAKNAEFWEVKQYSGQVPQFCFAMVSKDVIDNLLDITVLEKTKATKYGTNIFYSENVLKK